MSILFFLHNLEIKYDLQSKGPCCCFLWVLLSHTGVIRTLFPQSEVRGKKPSKCRRCRRDSGSTVWNQFKNTETHNFGEMTELCWIHHLPDGLVKMCISCIMNEIQTVGHPASVCYLWSDVIAGVLKLPLLLVGSRSLIGGASIISTQAHVQPLWLEDMVKKRRQSARRKHEKWFK